MPRGIYTRKTKTRAKTYKRKTAPAPQTTAAFIPAPIGDGGTSFAPAIRGLAVNVTADSVTVVFGSSSDA